MTDDPVQRRLRDTLYSEAMLLADEARGYFDELGRRDSAHLDPAARVQFSCESLKVTARVMHAVAWLLTRRAVDAGEIAPVVAALPAHRLGDAPDTDAAALDSLPERARALVEASIDLHRRIALLDQALDAPTDSPARAMQERLAQSF